MDNLISAVLVNYVPTVIIISIIIGIFVIAIAGVIRNSGKHDDIARSNLIIQTVVVGLIMLFLSGAFVFGFHQVYVSRFYAGIEKNLSEKLPASESLNNTTQLESELKESKVTITDPKCVLVVVDTIDCVKKTINDIIGTVIAKSIFCCLLNNGEDCAVDGGVNPNHSATTFTVATVTAAEDAKPTVAENSDSILISQP